MKLFLLICGGEMRERRLFERIEVPLKVRYQVLSASSKFKRIKSKSKNVGWGGVRILLSDEVPVDTKLHLEFLPEADDKQTLVAYGEVVWTKKIDAKGKKMYDTGVRFTQIDSIFLGRLLSHFTRNKR